MLKNLKLILVPVTAFLFGINLNNKTSLFCVILFSISILQPGWRKAYRIRVSAYSMFIIVFLLSYTLIDFIYMRDIQQTTITYFVLPAAAYLTGHCLVITDRDGSLYHKVILYASAGFFAYGILNIIQRYADGYNTFWWVAAGRMCVNYWTGNEMWPTLEATLFLPVSALLFYALFIQKSLVLKLGYLAVYAVTIWAALDIGSRAVIVLPLVMTILFLFYYYRSVSILQSRKGALFVKLMIAVLIATILYCSNTAGIKDIVESSNLYSRLTGQTYDNVGGFFELNGRDVRYRIILKEMPTHLLGGIDLGGDVLSGGLGSAHNTWLDIYRAVGIIPFMLFIYCTIMLILRMRYLIKTYTLFDEKVMPLLSVLIIINIQFLSESMFVLNTQLINFYFMLCGMLDCIYLTVRRKPVINELPERRELLGRRIGYGQSEAS